MFNVLKKLLIILKRDTLFILLKLSSQNNLNAPHFTHIYSILTGGPSFFMRISHDKNIP